MSRGVRAVVLAVLVVDAVLLAWVEVAWASFSIGAVPAPVSVLAALVTTPLLVLGARAAGAPFVPVVVWTLTVLVTGLWSPAGPGALPPDWRAILLIAVGVLPAVVVATRSPRGVPLPASGTVTR